MAGARHHGGAQHCYILTPNISPGLNPDQSPCRWSPHGYKWQEGAPTKVFRGTMRHVFPCDASDDTANTLTSTGGLQCQMDP